MNYIDIIPIWILEIDTDTDAAHQYRNPYGVSVSVNVTVSIGSTLMQDHRDVVKTIKIRKTDNLNTFHITALTSSSG